MATIPPAEWSEMTAKEKTAWVMTKAKEAGGAFKPKKLQESYILLRRAINLAPWRLPNPAVWSTTDIFGTEILREIDPNNAVLRYRSYQEMARDYNFVPIDWTNNQSQNPACCLGYRNVYHLNDLMFRWETSNAFKDLIACLKKNLEEPSSRLRNVKRIICFEFGCMSNDISCIKHLIAVEIGRVITSYQKANPKHEFYVPVKIIAQDAPYCEYGKKYLEKIHDVAIRINPSGLLSVNENTFVISIGAKTCIRQIVADSTQLRDGPAGMLCDKIQSNGHDHLETTLSTDDPDSENLWEYRSENCDQATFTDNDPFIAQIFSNLELYMKRSTGQPLVQIPEADIVNDLVMWDCGMIPWTDLRL
ncbi:hypothetical protein K505DRAFT_363844 [Melanomma pulvis-pyrius CBS 109.77]|uniref:SRR1-like domain-containing protein n=1 Tax=Melanomma pulvis-pyrius CBS 109.77 TaxID=1314802 RepID=A0A6A6X5L7_9PLEO|nr:hypothetical protein K505DRAFT_363844 [Melanomma pulvis-pyrius CBS 109.77]